MRRSDPISLARLEGLSFDGEGCDASEFVEVIWSLEYPNSSRSGVSFSLSLHKRVAMLAGGNMLTAANHLRAIRPITKWVEARHALLCLYRKAFQAAGTHG